MSENKITAVVETVTPEMAKAYLATSEGNVRWSDPNKLYANRTVNKYANSMLNNNWELNGEAIVFSESGKLKEGHHRMAAIIKAGVPAQMLVVRGISDNVKTFDEGRPRNAVQVMRNAWGVNVTGTLNSAVLIWVVLTEGEMAGRSLDTADRVAILEDKLWYDADVMCYRTYDGKRPIYKGGIVCAVYAALKCGEDPDRVKEFTDIALTGISTSADDTAAVIANKYLIDNTGTRNMSGYPGGATLAKYMQTCLFDFCQYKPRTKKYQKTIAYYTDRWAKIYARDAERINK